MRVANVQAGHLNLSEMKTIPATEPEIAELHLLRGDVLLTEGGDHDKLGRGALLDVDVGECIHQNHTYSVCERIRLRCCRSTLLLSCKLQTEVAKHYFLKSAKKATNLASINMTQLRALPVVLPPLDLQRQFAERIAHINVLSKDLGRGTLVARHAFESFLAGVFSVFIPPRIPKHIQKQRRNDLLGLLLRVPPHPDNVLGAR